MQFWKHFPAEADMKTRRKRTQGVADHRQYTALSVIGHEMNGKHRV